MGVVASWRAVDPELVGVWVAALLTLLVLSAAFGENRFSRAAIALLAGTAVGYVAAVTARTVLWPRFLLVWRDPAGQWPLLVWFGLGLLLLARGLTSASWLSNLSLAYLFGVGAALAVGGAALGTVVPQFMAVAGEARPAGAGSWGGAASALLIALGTGGVLFRLAYTGQAYAKGALARAWQRVTRAWARVGDVYLVVAFGALFATAIVSLLTLLASRLHFLLAEWLRLPIG